MNTKTPAFSANEPPEVITRSHDRYHVAMQACAKLPPVRTAVVFPCDAVSLTSAIDARNENLIEPVLIGPKDKILKVAADNSFNISGYEIVDVPADAASGEKAAELASKGNVRAIMKGSLHTDDVLRPIVSSQYGLRIGKKRLSHSYLMDPPNYDKWLIITDAVVNIAPDLKTKVDICENAALVWKALTGEERLPKIAALAAVEVVNPDMPATIDAACLSKMVDRKQIKGCIIDGPLAFDNAFSKIAAKEKGIVSDVAGDPDIMLAPDIEAGNIMAKQLIFAGKADTAGLIVGAKVPVILTSRADNLRARLLSCALALLVSNYQHKQK